MEAYDLHRKKITSTLINVDKYAGFMINADKYTYSFRIFYFKEYSLDILIFTYFDIRN